MVIRHCVNAHNNAHNNKSFIAMREILCFVLLKTLMASDALFAQFGDCGAYQFRERCNKIACSGFMESSSTFERNNQRLTWKSCNESIRYQMREMFPGLKFEHNNPKKCAPVCITFDLSRCGPAQPISPSPPQSGSKGNRLSWRGAREP